MGKFRYIGKAINLQGSTGKAWPAAGADDPDSAEYGACIYEPDNNEHQEAFYVDPNSDIERIG